MLNRWETALVTLVLVLAINAGLFFLVYLPRVADPPGAALPELTERTTLTTPPPENTTPKTTLESTSATATETSTASATATATATSTVSP